MKTLMPATIIFIFVLLLPSFAQKDNSKQKKGNEYAVIGYVGGFRGLVDATSIDVKKLTHINYAFVNVKDSMAWLTNLATDTINFRKLNERKKDNPNLKILISVGGWSWSENFSDAVLTPSSRKKFASSSAAIVRSYGLDGVDIDWEYPGMKGEDNVYRAEDKRNYTLMFKALREELDRLEKETGKTYELTTAVGGFTQFLDHVEMSKAQQYLDFVNLMTYDFFVAGDTAGHHTNLFPSEDYSKERSAHRSVNEFIEAGVPPEKLVMGIAFYGRSWYMRSPDNRGINRPVKEVTRGGGYTFIKDSLLAVKENRRYWDEHAKAPYLFNATTMQLVSFDDEESIRHKCNYVKEHELGGVMFWEYASDPGGTLLEAIHESLKHP